MKHIHHKDEAFMRRCLDLAALGAGKTSPNPMVGCVIVHGESIIGEGWHRHYGGAHAEVHALNSVKDKSMLEKAVLYVNLEPCSHFGKTPPCADLIVRHNIPRVVIGSLDENPVVSGNGVKRLRDSGTEVSIGVLEKDALELNRFFFTYHRKKRPYIFLKWARSRDGFLAPPDGKAWLSNAASQRLTHKWRHEMDAILVGRKTAATDDPLLTDRFWNGRNPLRIILDPKNSLSDDLRLFRDGNPVLVLNEEFSGIRGNVNYARLGPDGFKPGTIMDRLYDKKIMSVMVEGGADTLARFIDSGLWDQAVVYVSEQDLGNGIPAPQFPGAPSEKLKLDSNYMEIYRQ